MLEMAIRWSDVPVIDIGEKMGHTDYIDFIKEDEVTDSVTKGIDICRRPFYVIKAEVVDNRGKVWPVFETFFQRYTNNTHLWMGCGHYGDNFMDTGGGMERCQIRLLVDLVENGSVELTPELIDTTRISYDLVQKIKDDGAVPILLRLADLSEEEDDNDEEEEHEA